MEHPIARAAKTVGNQTVLAAALKVSKVAVSQWKQQGSRVPAEYCPVIERLTAGAVRCEELRPDIEWSVLRNEDGNLAVEVPSTQEPIHG